MPFVVIVQNPDTPVKYNGFQLENACKEAWVAMKHHSDTGPFEAGDVGGLMALDARVMVGKPGDCVFQFYYSEQPDRGLAFRESLFNELRMRLPQSIDVIPVPTKYWFKDPVWTVKKEYVETDSGMAIDDIPF